MTAVDALLVLRVVLIAYVAAWLAWWAVLSAIALAPRRGGPRRAVRPFRWAVIVPAHNEATSIAACVASLRRAGSLLPEPPMIVVVADNCSDATGAIAKRAGAWVLTRTNTEQIGKGFALEYAVQHLRDFDPQPQAFAFVDADTEVDERFLVALQHTLERGEHAAQAYYGVAGRSDDLTALRRLAFKILHWSRPLGARRLGLGMGIKGNGMALRRTAAVAGLGSGGLAEDAAMTLALARRGIRVAFAPDARVYGQMAGTYNDASVQDDRWERGRFGLYSEAVRSSLAALRQGRVSAAAGALDVLAPPLSLTIVVLAMLGATFVVVPGPGALVAAGGLVAAGLYLVFGLAAARVSPRELLALRMAPRFVLYKVGVLVRAAWPWRQSTWERTARPADR